MKTKFVRFSKLSPRNLSDWNELSYHSEPNAFATVEFISAAVQAFSVDPLVLLIHDDNNLVGVGAFERKIGTRAFPFPHLVSFMSEHSFSGGIMIHEGQKPYVMSVLLEIMSGWISPLGGFEIPKMYIGSDTHRCLSLAASNMYIECEVLGVYSRSVLRIKDRTDKELTDILGSKRVLDNTRNKRKLTALGIGGLSWRSFRGEIPKSVVESFLRIENTGWKKTEQTALGSTQAGRRFFNNLICNFQKSNRVLFTELCIGGRVIASTVNFLIRDVGFAFKIAVDDEFKKFSIGIMNEIEFMKNCKTAAPDIVITVSYTHLTLPTICSV